MTQLTQDQEFKVLSPENEVTLSTGETISIKPFTFGQLPKAIGLAGGLNSLIQNAFSDKESPDLVSLVRDGGEELIALVAFGIKKPREWFDDLATDDGVLLTTQFLEVNMDFFVQKVMPQFKKGMEKFKRLQTASQSSSAEASPTKK